jgi:uncharacterized LabA/DUF88 family protein
LFFGWAVRVEPSEKRAVVFVDGQNLFHAARDTFGCTFPNFDVSALAKALAARQGWVLAGVRFYTGIPDASDNAHWHRFWTAKLAAMGRQGVVVFSRPLRYRNRTVRLRDGTSHVVLTGEEKGIDVRIALDVIAGAHRGAYDVALILSQDQDLSEVATEIRVIAREQDRWIKIASAFPVSPAASNRRGINSTDWIPIDRALYDQCLDRRDYRAGGGAGHGLGDGG